MASKPSCTSLEATPPPFPSRGITIQASASTSHCPRSFPTAKINPTSSDLESLRMSLSILWITCQSGVSQVRLSCRTKKTLPPCASSPTTPLNLRRRPSVFYTRDGEMGLHHCREVSHPAPAPVPYPRPRLRPCCRLWNIFQVYPCQIFNNQPKIDIAMIPASGFSVLGFLMDDPGTWLMHCYTR